MGLTIYYSLESDTPSPRRARGLLERLQQAARDLPFAEVGDLFEVDGEEIDDEQPPDDESRHWLLVQAKHWLEHETGYSQVDPEYVIAFSTWPGPGCESANFGLCRYPPAIEDQGKVIPTGLEGWHWRSFCKTQYASDPQAGGLEHFLRCHLSVIRLLDCAQRLGILADVGDDGGYWKSRDIDALAREIGQWNRLVAGIIGQFKDHFSENLIAPIKDFPNFEHLEAEARRDESEDAPQE